MSFNIYSGNGGIHIGEHKDDWEKGYPHKPVNTEAMAKLLKFCANNEDLDRLERFIGAFNPFKILGVADYEIRHSNVLAWLLDPNSHHGLGDLLFKNILLEALKSRKKSTDNKLPQINEVLDTAYTDLKIMREWRNIDLLAVSQDKNTVFVIENKLGASEEETQLARYAKIVKDKYSSYKQIFVFLTLDGADPKECDLYIPLRHKQIHDIVKSVVEVRKDYLNAKVYDFVSQYLNVLEEKLMPNDEFVATCSKLYRDHKDAISMILEHGRPKMPLDKLQYFHNETETESIYTGEGVVKMNHPFIPRTWSDVVPKTNSDYQVCFSFGFKDYESHKIPLWLYISNFSDPEERQRFIDMLSEVVEKNKNSKLTVDKTAKKSTTLYRKDISLKSQNNQEYNLHDYDMVIGRLIEEFNSDEVQEALKIVGGVVQKFGFEDANK
jgi:hypothetical protein